MKTVNVHDAKTHFSRLLAEVESKGQSIAICRNGKPVADLQPHQGQRSRLKTDPKLRRIIINYEPVEPLSESEWPGATR